MIALILAAALQAQPHHITATPEPGTWIQAGTALVLIFLAMRNARQRNTRKT